MRRRAHVALALVVIAACGVSDARTISERPAASARQPSIEEMLESFRRTVRGAPPATMQGANGIDELVTRFALSLERADTNAFREMAVTRGEFAYLYYPESPYTEPPYRQDPALLWFMIHEGSNKGLTRLFNRYAGSSLGHVGHVCVEQPEQHGRTRLWTKCFVRRVSAPGDTITDRLFGTIVERDGRFKFLSYANKL